MAGNEVEKPDANDDSKFTNPEAEPKPKDSELGVELGVEYNLPFAAPYNDGLSKRAKEAQELRELLRGHGEEFGPTVAQLIAMRRLDGQARALYRLLTLPIRSSLSKSTFRPADGGEAEAEFIDQVFNLPPSAGGMSVTFHRFMSQMLQGLFDGFAPFEQVFWMPAFGPLKGKYTLRKLAYRQPDTISVIEDEDGHFQGFRQRAYRGGKTVDVHIPRERAFYFAAQEEERKYYGVSFFQSAFYHYDKKIKMYYIAHLAAQRAAVGTRVGTYPANATTEQRRTLAQNLSNLALAQWMMVPENTKVEMLKEGGTFPFLDYINHHNNQMSKSILANFFDKDSGGGSGDAKLVSFGQPGDDMFVLMLRTIMDDIANQINHYIIPKLIDWNFDSGKYPTFQWAELTDDQKALINNTFNTLASRETVSPEFTRELEKKMANEMGLEIDWEAVEEREAADAETQNFMQGIGPDGKPLPKDAMGNPILPGQPDPESALRAFEQLNGGGGEPAAALAGPGEGSGANEPEEEDDPKKKKNLKLSASPDEDILQMAADLMGAAQLELAERKVRTEEGARLYGKPIGTVITGSTPQAETEDDRPTIERLQSLKAQFDEFMRVENTAEAGKIRQMLRAEIAKYAGDSSVSTFFQVMKKLQTGD